MSENVVRILMISMYLAIANGTAGSIMMATEKHKPMARWAVYEALLNLGLSIVLVKKIGMYGVAWGTAISMIYTHLASWPRYVKKILDVPVTTYLWQGWGRITVCALPFAALCWFTERAWPAAHLVQFFAQIAVILPVYALCVAAMFRRESRDLVGKWQASRRPAVLQTS